VVAGEQFGVDNGMLNAQFKLRRTQIATRYGQDLERVYREHDVYNDGTISDVPVMVTAAGRPGTEEPEER
jgi:long-chain acyl-CoA synthetase